MGRIQRGFLRNMEFSVHIMSYTAGKESLLKEKEREQLVRTIERFSQLFFVQVVGYCVMDNHFHLLVKTKKHEDYSDEEIIERLIAHYGVKKFEECYADKPMYYYRQWLSCISNYVQMIKKTFSNWFNKRRNRVGTLWGERFKSVLVEEGGGLLVCMSYIDMNPVRKGFIESPEQYKWSRYGRTINNKIEEKSFYTYEGTGMTDIFAYSDYLNEYGRQDRSFQGKKGKIEGKASLRDRLMEKLIERGVAIGSKEFIAKNYKLHEGNKGLTKKDRSAYSTGIQELFSLRNIQI